MKQKNINNKKKKNKNKLQQARLRRCPTRRTSLAEITQKNGKIERVSNFGWQGIPMVNNSVREEVRPLYTFV
jgi:hypothetical protein